MDSKWRGTERRLGRWGALAHGGIPRLRPADFREPGRLGRDQWAPAPSQHRRLRLGGELPAAARHPPPLDPGAMIAAGGRWEADARRAWRAGLERAGFSGLVPRTH